jgi:hypothetical protein
LLNTNKGRTSHVLEEDAVFRVEETLDYGRAGRMLRKDLIDLEFSLKLLSLKVARFRDLDHDARMDLIDKGDASSPDPVHIRELLPDIHNRNNM